MSTPVTNDPNISWESKDHSLNAYIELVYIRFGNQMTTEQLTKLQAALQSSDNAVNVLKEIMAMRNNGVTSTPQLTFEDFAKDYNPEGGPDKKGAYEKGYGKGFTYDDKKDSDYGSTDNYLKAFNQANKAYEQYKNDNLSHSFGYGGKVWTGASDPQYQDWAKNMMVYRQNLKVTIDGLAAHMTDAQKADPNSIFSKLNEVYNSMPNNANDFNGWKTWVMDGYGGGGTSATGSGKIQQLLDSASTAATSFLNTTTEALQRFLNIMEQYYKSANEILKTTSDNIKTYARGISGR